MVWEVRGHPQRPLRSLWLARRAAGQGPASHGECQAPEDGFLQEAAAGGLGTRGIFLLKQMRGREHVKDH